MATNPAEIGKVGYGHPPVATRFQPGNNANPGGKPTGARNALNAKFLKTLSEDFEKGGAAAIALCRETDPSAYVRALVALQPKELEVHRGPIEDLSDEQLDAAIAAVRAVLAAQGAGGSADNPQGSEPAQGVSPLSETAGVP